MKREWFTDEKKIYNDKWDNTFYTLEISLKNKWPPIKLSYTSVNKFCVIQQA